MNIRHLFSTITAGILTISLSFSVVSCGNQKPAAAQETADAQAEETTEAENGNSMSLTAKDIEALKDKFIFDETSGYYYHKHWNRNFPARRTLTADVNKSGYFFLCSNFFGNKGINHSKVVVKIGDLEMTSEDIDKNNANEHVVQKTPDGNVFEVNYYTNYRDKGIFEAIGKSKAEKIEIKFIGPKSFTQFEELKALDIDALKDCYMLSLVLRMGA